MVDGANAVNGERKIGRPPAHFITISTHVETLARALVAREADILLEEDLQAGIKLLDKSMRLLVAAIRSQQMRRQVALGTRLRDERPEKRRRRWKLREVASGE